MRKMIGIALLLMLAFGMPAGLTAHAAPGSNCGDLGTPVDVSCRTVVNGHETSCEVWVSSSLPGAGCYNPV